MRRTLSTSLDQHEINYYFMLNKNVLGHESDDKRTGVEQSHNQVSLNFQIRYVINTLL